MAISLRMVLVEAALLAAALPIYLLVKAHPPDRTLVAGVCLGLLVAACVWILGLRDKSYLPSNLEVALITTILVVACVALAFAWH
jgi:hypothetical protein